MAAKKENVDLFEQKAVECDKQKFSKSQIVRCSKYHDRRDLVDALLDDNKKYTKEQVDRLIGEFMKGKVK